ncbi:hypothetical protein POM88_038987 [Heracleum sosnowskyi]|uniref:Pectinesterase inhibitor domain-containing protein n=1 Tax=Heracleum sosnowskyi TaxID=360622 RepID=A0AAD8HAL8_9APIA|nr:hypothetical protein POM88_038987 [Heracleum sosnowskyi]
MHINRTAVNSSHPPHQSQIRFVKMNSTKTTLLEKQPSSELPKNNTLKLYILSLVIALSLVSAGILFITTVINFQGSNPSSPDFIDLTPSTGYSIRTICSFTPNKRLCRKTLSPIISSDNSALSLDYVFPQENIILRSFQLSVNQLIRLTNISKHIDIPELRECQVLLDKEMSELNNSVASIQNNHLFRQEVNEYLDRFRRMETYQQACLDKLQASGSPKIDEIRLNVQKMRRYMSNSRAVLLNIDPIVEKIYSSTSSSEQVDHDSIRTIHSSSDERSYLLYFINWLVVKRVLDHPIPESAW